jgi:arginase
MPPTWEIIGAPFDLGSGVQGCAKAPATLREKDLVRRLERLDEWGITVVDGGDVAAPRVEGPTGGQRHLPELIRFCDDLMAKLAGSYRAGHRPVLLGGDHTISVATVSAAARHVRETYGEESELGLLWVDAHPDLETPEVRDGADLHGMSVALLLGHGIEELVGLGGFSPKIRPENVAFIGLRDVVRCEREMIREHGILSYTLTDVERLGIGRVCEEAFARVCEGTAGFVMSFDIDVCCPHEAPGVMYREPGGLTYREAMVVMESAARADGLLSLELVEYNPDRDRDDLTRWAAIEFLKTGLGRRFV